ncbi:ATP-binding cassette domain-containing protein [Paracoccus albus]|uniref:ATP-binding cassette domain-containing protein n=1 Tax=Paracoccus albus TaxID=3017784 RepID=UPI0022F04F6F|nr:ATP-binding cassette domain-containing protein [Paracoccus albus]WBU61124.1 ATP-binding cassette domain-containing protein [Paracoccus albus]
MNAIEFDRCSIIFGKRPEAALNHADAGKDRSDIQELTGNTLGVHNATLNVTEGEIVVLMGLSGSGKSTLLRAVNGLNPVLRGDVRVRMGSDMISVPNASKDQLRALRLNHVSMVFQQFGLLPWRSVAENIGLGLELAGLAPAARITRVAEQIKTVGLDQWADRPVGELSGGMQQRVGLARAFATDAPILLMDEPFSALDPLIRTRLQDELLLLQETSRRTILFVSHDLDEAFKLGSRIALMEGGRIVQIGTARQILARPANDYVAEFVAHMNPLEVLTASDLAAPGSAEGAPLPADLPLRKVLGALRNDDARPVTGGGIITRDHVLRRLSA